MCPRASCKAQAAKQFSAIHFVQRRNFVDDCLAQHGSAQMHAKGRSCRTGRAGQLTTTAGHLKQAQVISFENPASRRFFPLSAGSPLSATN